MKTIVLSGGKYAAIVDDEDYPILSRIKWHILKHAGNLYARNRRLGKMHQIIMPLSVKNQVVDHKDGNGLNNQKSNLRYCTTQQNSFNRGKKKIGSSKYKGVHFDKQRNLWVASIKIDKKHKYLGGFQKEEDAAREYDIYCTTHYKEFARPNFSEVKP